MTRGSVQHFSQKQFSHRCFFRAQSSFCKSHNPIKHTHSLTSILLFQTVILFSVMLAAGRLEGEEKIRRVHQLLRTWVSPSYLFRPPQPLVHPILCPLSFLYPAPWMGVATSGVDRGCGRPRGSPAVARSSTARSAQEEEEAARSSTACTPPPFLPRTPCSTPPMRASEVGRPMHSRASRACSSPMRGGGAAPHAPSDPCAEAGGGGAPRQRI
jgi:hypothetical protein